MRTILNIDQDESKLYTFTQIYLALLDSDKLSQEQLDLLKEHRIIKDSTPLVEPEPKTSRSIIKYNSTQFNHSREVNRSLSKMVVAVDSPYKIDKLLNVGFESGLTVKWPMNSTVALVEIGKGDDNLGYIAISSDNKAAAIVRNPSSGKCEIHLQAKNSCLDGFIDDYEMVTDDPKTQESIYVNKTLEEKNKVFEIRTGFASLGHFLKSNFLDETNEIVNLDKAINRLMNRSSIESLAGMRSGDLTEDKFKLAAQLQDLIIKSCKDELIEDYQARSIEDIFLFKSRKHSKDITDYIAIDTDIVRKFPSETMKKMDIEPLSMSLFQTTDNTTFVVHQGRVKMYRPDEPIYELDNLPSDDYTFQLAEMMYVGQCTITRPLLIQQEREVMQKDNEQEQAINTLSSKFRVNNYPAFISEIVNDNSTFEQIEHAELATGLIAGKTAYEIVNDHYPNKHAENIVEYINELNEAIKFNERAFASMQEEAIELLELGYGFAASKVTAIHWNAELNERRNVNDVMLDLMDEQNIKYFCNASGLDLLVQIDDKLVNCMDESITEPDQEFVFQGVTLENTAALFEMMSWRFIGDFEITTNYQSSASTPSVEKCFELKNNIIVEMNHHLQNLSEFIADRYTGDVIIAPPALAEFLDDMAGYSFVHSNQEYGGVEFVEIWNHYEDYYKRSPTPLLAAVMEDLSENHDTRAYDFETTLERALNMVEGVEPEPEPETPKAKPRNKMKI